MYPGEQLVTDGIAQQIGRNEQIGRNVIWQL
jgi:hypothetical protein